jgi:hypothetical protein
VTFLVFNAGDLLGRLFVTDVPIDKIPNLPRKLFGRSPHAFSLYSFFYAILGHLYTLRWPFSDTTFSLVVQFLLFAVWRGVWHLLSAGTRPDTGNDRNAADILCHLNFSLCLGFFAAVSCLPVALDFCGTR